MVSPVDGQTAACACGLGWRNNQHTVAVMPAQAGIHKHSELRWMDQWVRLGTLMVHVDPSLRWGDGARLLGNQPIEAARVVPHARSLGASS